MDFFKTPYSVILCKYRYFSIFRNYKLPISQVDTVVLNNLSIRDFRIEIKN